MEVTYTDHGIFVSQERYLLNLLKKFDMENCREASTPLEVTHKLSKYDGADYKDMRKYQSLVGSLIYATLTRPDLSYVVGVLSQFMHCPKDPHWILGQRVLRYIKGTIKEGLYYPFTSDLKLRAYSDSDWAGNQDDRRSTHGYMIYIGDKLVSWCSKKQHIVALSSTKAKYKGLVVAAKELIWMQTLFKSLGIDQGTPTIHGDNMSSLYLAANPVFHARTKHIEIEYHFLREKVMEKEIEVEYISTKDQLADIMTKSLDGVKTNRFKSMTGVKEKKMI
ncbi:hypothetical protein KP509_15G022400 [Ceratopteris richardii]|uniref:Uncharacterized protein n=1 Tax=Ceratopteris richardii TaxID=49495 RepID=A0A8T2T7Q1_CERRI|nr:hypothetical protein KP509_15G022400 [Ceratopteris richardii]